MRKILLILISICIIHSALNAQTIITTAAAGNIGYDGGNYSESNSAVSFAIQNTNSYAIKLNGIETIKSPSLPYLPLNPGSKYYLWYSATSLSDTAIVTSPNWTIIDSVSNLTLSTGYNTLFSTLNFTIPANTTYRFALQSLTGISLSGGLSYIGGPGGGFPNFVYPSILSADGVNLLLGDYKIGGFEVGWVGPFSYLQNNLAWFTGSISFSSTIVCTTPPVAGATTSTSGNACRDIPFQLNISGNTAVNSQTYQWESSPNGTNWTPIAGATKSSLTTTQQVSTHYHCAVTCSGNTTYSTPLQITTPAAVSGTFTINNNFGTSGTNFQSFADAISYISCGINGPVVFNVLTPSGGAYYEQITIPFIGGSSSINTITFNGRGQVLSYNAGSPGLNTVLTLNGAKHIILDSLIIDCATANDGWGILFTNNADSNIVRKCTINANPTVPYIGSNIGIVFNGSTKLSPSGLTGTAGNNGSDNLITNNFIDGGSSGVYLYGAGTRNTGNKIINNIITNVYAHSIFASYQNNLLIGNNDISRPTRGNSNSTASGLFITFGCSNTIAEKNKIHNMYDAISSSAGYFYAIFVAASPSIGQENKIINNLIYNMTGNYTLTGIANSGGSNMQAYHNTVILDDQSTVSGDSYGLSQIGNVTGVSFKNNLVYVTRAGGGIQRCISYFKNATPPINSDHNAYFINCPSSIEASIAQYDNVKYATIASWKAANGGAFDQSSVFADPLFVNAASGNYTPAAPPINDIGANLGVTIDILGNSRGISPDPGAYEFSIAACTNTPIAGTAIVTVNDVCPNNSFTLELSGNSYGAGQTYQWQSSPNNSSWTNVGTASTTSIFSNTQNGSSYYRCAVQCSGGTTVYSSSVQITTPTLSSGNFTINSSVSTGGTNFQSFTDAINAIRCGITGPVVFNVTPGSGPYNENITIPSIKGSSATNTITIHGGGTSVVFSSNNSHIPAGIILNGADHIFIDSLTVDVSGGNYCWGILITNQADSNIISHCTVITSITYANSNAMGIIINGFTGGNTSSGNNGNYNQIVDNTVIGGYQGIYLFGDRNNTTTNINNIVKRNTILDTYGFGIFAEFQSAGLVISENDISRPNRQNTTVAGGVYLYPGCAGALIEKNKIHNLFDVNQGSTAGAYAFYINANPPIGQENKVINNLVYNMNGEGTVYGVYCSQTNNLKVYHNTFVFDDQATVAGGVTGFYQNSAASGMEFKNNLVYITRSGTGIKKCIYLGNASNSIISNNNILFVATDPNNSIGQLQGTYYSTLASWKTANSNAYDQLSVSVDPLFTNAAAFDYKPTAVAADNIGKPQGVTQDITGVIRSVISPDAGAYEFGVILPVNGLNFKGQRNGTINKLEWTTATETNSLGFELLRSYTTNSNEFKKINFISSKATNGISNSTLNYSYDDAISTENNIYYKLKQIDKDGRFSFSNVVEIKAEKPAIVDIATIYPNPVADNLNVSITSPGFNKTTLIIADMFGKVVMQQNIQLNLGINISSLNVSKLASGSYSIKLSCGTGCTSTIKKFVKL